MKFFFCMCSLFISQMIWAQLYTSTGHSPASMVSAIQTDGSISVMNVAYSGYHPASAKFNGSASNLGLDSGIVLTTGVAALDTSFLYDPDGPVGPNDNSSDGVDNGFQGDTLLSVLAGNTTYNAAILEFDFIPHGDSVFITLVFGSEEYPEFVGGGFNDIFGVFISGPGFTDTTNIALLPSGAGVISIDNINNGMSNAGPCQNCSFYVNNGTGSTAPQNTNPYYIQYDGFTIPIEINSAVQCGETYHITVAIADVGDDAYDSGIFIKANSFKSNAIGGFAFHQNGIDINGASIHIDSLSSITDSLATAFYVVNNSGFDTTFSIRRNKLTDVAGWEDAVCFPDTCFDITAWADWTNPVTDEIFVSAGDSVLISPVIYTHSVAGCAIYEYQVLTACGFSSSSVQMTYSIGGQSCYLGAENEQEIVVEEDVILYPNPVKDDLTVVWVNATGFFDVYLVGMDGRMTERTKSVDGRATIRTQELVPGIYIVVLTDAEGLIRREKMVRD